MRAGCHESWEMKSLQTVRFNLKTLRQEFEKLLTELSSRWHGNAADIMVISVLIGNKAFLDNHIKLIHKPIGAKLDVLDIKLLKCVHIIHVYLLKFTCAQVSIVH